MTTTTTQIQRADRLATEMSCDGHEVDAATVLDYLAICGFQLEDGADAKNAYGILISSKAAMSE